MLLVSINPDLKSTVGHSLYLDRELAREAAQRSWKFASWGHKDLPEELTRDHEWLRPTFQDTSYHKLNHDAAHRERFLCDLVESCRAALEQHPDEELLLFVYTGHVCQMASFWRLLQELPSTRLRIVFNLYAAYWDFEESSDRFKFLVDTLRRTLGPGALLADRQRFTLVSDSTFIARQAERWWPSAVSVIPFFSLARTQPLAPHKAEPHEVQDGVVTVAYPSSVHRHRGFFVFPAMVRHCRQLTSRKLRFVFRTGVAEHLLSPEERDVCRQLKEMECELMFGSFSDEEMCRFYNDADIILNPYPVRYFKDRTSANVADALVFGKPVIAARGTWAGRLIDERQCGACFEDGSGLSMAEAVIRVVNNLGTFTRHSQVQGANWSSDNNISALITRLQNLRDNPPTRNSHESEMHFSDENRSILLTLLDSPSNESPFAPDPQTIASATSQALQLGRALEIRRWKRAEQRLEQLMQQAEAMRRAIEHYRASPVRALRMWFFRKRRRLTI